MDLEKLKQDYAEKKKKIENRLKEFASFKNEEELFYEACFCILTPQSNAKKCWQAVEKLNEADFKNKNLNPSPIIKKLTRFHNNKGKHLIEFKKNYPEFSKLCTNAEDSKHLRNQLAEKVKGWGLKESSHFLRNTGHKNLAILDRYILKNLQKYGAIEEIPKTLNQKKYKEIEQKFSEFSKKINIPMDHLDLLFWSQETGEIFK